MSFVCSVCGETHDHFPTWVAHRWPNAWTSQTPAQQAQGLCNDDLCRTADQRFFLRAVIQLPLIDGPEPIFEIGAWVQLAPLDFDRYVDTFNAPDQAKIGPMAGALANQVAGFPGSLGHRVIMQPQNDLQRPFLQLDESDHPLALAQRQGIGFARAHEIVKDSGVVQ